jgi:hypothetical protein
MVHLSDDSIYSLTFEHATLGAEATAHLHTCAACQARASASRDIADALRVARFSAPSPAQRERLLALASLVQTSSTGQRIVGWLRAQLAMDTRAAPLASGVRGMDVAYRLLYAAPALDVELMVEPANATRTIHGALLPHTQGDEGDTALVQLEDGEKTRFDTETSADGRFTFRHVQPGVYRLWIVRADSAEVVLEMLEIS